MKGLFLLPRLPWPTHDGQAVIAHHLLRELADLGHHLRIALLETPTQAALEAWPLRHRVGVDVLHHTGDTNHLTARQGRWLSYFGLPAALPAAVRSLVERVGPDYVEVFGLSVLPLLGRVRDLAPVIWMAADDRCLHQLTALRAQHTLGGIARSLRDAAAMAAYERSFAHAVDAAVAVAEPDRRALRWIGGFGRVVTITNGVELPVTPGVAPLIQPRTVMFWGNLDFEPNIQAVRFFASHVWPMLARRHGDALWWIAGSGRGEQVHRLTATVPGVKLMGCVEDLPSAARRAAAVVIPMLSGTGVKNKLLEAAAVARPIVASPRAVSGLSAGDEAPWLVARRPADWVEHIQKLWNAPASATQLGARARQWVAQHHDWRRAAAAHHQLIADLRQHHRPHPLAPQPRSSAA